MSSKEVEIFVFYYKPGGFIPALEEYTPIFAGKNQWPEISGFTGDDTRQNISSKNKYYSELTGLFWVWKNTNSAVVGSCHYRRFFTVGKEPFRYRAKRFAYYFAGIRKKRFGLIYTSNEKFWSGKLITASETKSILEQFDAIFPVRRILNYSIEKHYKRYHNASDLQLLKNIIAQYYPGYISAFDRTMAGNRLFANNMFIMPRNLFNSLMEWLFFILFKFEESTEMKNFEGYQQRIFGFLSERLITVWLEHHQLNYKELPLIYFKKFKTQKS